MTTPTDRKPTDWRDVLQRCIDGIDHLAEIARLWEPDHSSGADRRGWVLANDAADDARRLLAASDKESLTVAAPAVEVEPAGMPAAYEAVEGQIVGRYQVELTRSGFWGWCVKAGDGTLPVFVGHKRQCENVAAALQTACLDGAYMASKADDTAALASTPAQPERVGLTEEEVFASEDLMHLNGDLLGMAMPQFMRVVRAIERAHNIKEPTK